METKLTPGRAVLLQAVMTGEKMWSELRLAYYGPERVKEKASTSFHNQLNKMKMLDLIAVAPSGKYMLGEVGKQFVETHREELVNTFVSKAQQSFICKCETPCQECKCQ